MDVQTAPDNALDEVRASIRSLSLSMAAQLQGIQSHLQVQETRNTLSEVSARQQVLTQREKDRKFCVGSFSQPMAKFHAMDLFDIQQQLTDLDAHASLVSSTLASRFGTSASRHGAVVEIDPTQTVTLGQIAPLYDMLGHLLCMVDDKVHIQQMAGTSKVGYVHMYNFYQQEKGWLHIIFWVPDR